MRYLSAGVFLLLAGCWASLNAGCGAKPAGSVYQNSTIDALLDGNYDGEVTFAQLEKHGDFGIGTFDAVDGEMVAVGGHFFQARSDGAVRQVSADARTPFSAVTFFRPSSSRQLGASSTYRQLQSTLDAMRPADGHAYAFRVDGRFAEVKVRSVARQDRPYKPLAEVVQTQAVAVLKELEGTLVGFWFPESLRHVNVPGYHFHFIAEDRTTGGHVLDLALSGGVASMQTLETVTIALPRTAPTTRPGTDRSSELDQVEK